MKWKRSRKSKDQLGVAREHKSNNENPVSVPQIVGLGKQNGEEEEEVDNKNQFNMDMQHSDVLQKDIDNRYASDGDVEEMRKKRVGL